MSESIQNPTEYQPTKKEQNLLEALLDPANRLKSITEICRVAKCGRQAYYDAFKKPEFVEYYKQESKALASKHIGQVLNAFVKEASRGSFQHGKVLLEMAGLYKETIRKEVTGKDGQPVENTVTVVSRTAGLTKEQRLAMAQQLMQADDDPGDILEMVPEGTE